MRRCPKCGAIVADDAANCGLCGQDLFAVQNESLQDAVANDEQALEAEKKKTEQRELAIEEQAGRMVILSYAVLVGMILVGIVLATLQSDFLNVAGIILILFALLAILYRARGPRRGSWIARGNRL